MNELRHFYEGYLWGYLLMISFPVGALGIRLVHVMTQGAWGEPLKKYYMAASRTWGLSLVLIIPLIFGFKDLYWWTGSHDPHIQEKQFYLNIPFFAWRTGVYFVVWKTISFWLDRYNGQRDISGGLAVLYVLAGSFAGMDWVMSLDPHWYSTIFGLLFIMGQVLSGFCWLVCLYIFREKPGPNEDNRRRLRDQGNLILTMVMLWAYLAFSQYLIIWMGNMPEEIRWYLSRIKDGWGIVAIAVIAGHFFVPFFLLLRRSWKETRQSLAAIAVWILLMRVMDMAWMIFPGVNQGLSQLSFTHVVAALLVMGIYAVYFLRTLDR